MLKLRVGGVPEHFNLPWHLASEKGYLKEAGIVLEWTDFPGGTGAMAKALREDTIDLALILTEGIIADIAKGNRARILKVYVESPLTWGIHTSPESGLDSVDELEGAHYAISRYGSGSHLMAIVDARQRGLPLENMKFEVVEDITGALDAFNSKRVDAFLWEKYTTEPYGLKRIGTIPTPWPSFVIAINPTFYKKHKKNVEAGIDVVFDQAKALKLDSNGADLIASRYRLKKERASKWFRDVQWGTGRNLERAELTQIVEELQFIGVIDKDIVSSDKESFLI